MEVSHRYCDNRLRSRLQDGLRDTWSGNSRAYRHNPDRCRRCVRQIIATVAARLGLHPAEGSWNSGPLGLPPQTPAYTVPRSPQPSNPPPRGGTRDADPPGGTMPRPHATPTTPAPHPAQCRDGGVAPAVRGDRRAVDRELLENGRGHRQDVGRATRGRVESPADAADRPRLVRTRPPRIRRAEDRPRRSRRSPPSGEVTEWARRRRAARPRLLTGPDVPRAGRGAVRRPWLRTGPAGGAVGPAGLGGRIL